MHPLSFGVLFSMINLDIVTAKSLSAFPHTLKFYYNDLFLFSTHVEIFSAVEKGSKYLYTRISKKNVVIHSSKIRSRIHWLWSKLQKFRTPKLRTLRWKVLYHYNFKFFSLIFYLKINVTCSRVKRIKAVLKQISENFFSINISSGVEEVYHWK